MADAPGKFAGTDKGDVGAGMEWGVGPARSLGTLPDYSLKFRWVQGIASRVSDIRIRGEHTKVFFGDAVTGAELERKMSGASVLTIWVADPEGRLVDHPILSERHTATLDGLRWRYVACGFEGIGAPLKLTYEPEVVAELKEILGPHKSMRDRRTRAEFCRNLAFMLKPRPRFVAPEIHVVQPIATAKEGREAKAVSLDERKGGIDTGASLTVKGVKATPAQIDVGDRALRVAESLGAPTLAKRAMMEALIVEGVLGDASRNYYGMTPEVEAETGIAGDDLEASTKGFLTGYNSPEPGAIGEAQAHPEWPAYKITQAVQKSGAGLPSGGHDNYGPWEKEASSWLDAFGGADGGTSVSTVTTVKYAFKQGEQESNWACMNRLAGEVRWRCFESAGWIYFLNDESLLKQKIRMRISPNAPGVLNITGGWDAGKEEQELTVTAMAKEWSAPPGSAAVVSRCGPASGVYLVNKITSPLSGDAGVVSITLKRPVEPLPEPAAETKTETSGFTLGATGATEAPPAVAKMLAFCESEEGKPYVWGGTGPNGYDCSGFVSSVLDAGGVGVGHQTTVGLATYGEAGPGQFVTIHDHANTGDATSEHVIIQIEDRYFASGEGSPNGGVGEVPQSQLTASWLAHFEIKRHPKGL